jgi:restriction system protein
MSKHASLLALTRVRQDTRWQGYNCIGDYHDGVYECDHMSPYTKSAGNVDADVLILWQDWSCHERLSGPIDGDAVRSGLSPSLPTNQRLAHLLRTHLERELSDTYATTVFPFVKMGGLDSRIPAEDLAWAAGEYALPQIRIVSPQLVVCVGLETFNAVRVALERPRCTRIADAIENHFTFEDITIWCQAHPGALGQKHRNRDGVDRVSNDWTRMSEVLATRGQH